MGSQRRSDSSTISDKTRLCNILAYFPKSNLSLIKASVENYTRNPEEMLQKLISSQSSRSGEQIEILGILLSSSNTCRRGKGYRVIPPDKALRPENINRALVQQSFKILIDLLTDISSTRPKSGTMLKLLILIFDFKPDIGYTEVRDADQFVSGHS